MKDNEKRALLWGPVSSFTGPLTAWLTKKGWMVDIACKSSLNLLSLSPLDLKSAARGLLESSYQSRNKAKAFNDKYRFIEQTEVLKKMDYDIIIFAGLPPNFDESRGPRAPWSAAELEEVLRAMKPETDIIVVSSIYAAVQEDGVVPEIAEFDRRKSHTSWENICQQYESKLVEILSGKEVSWSLLRLPLICGSTEDGKTIKDNGLHTLFQAIKDHTDFTREAAASNAGSRSLRLNYAPDATLWFMPIDLAVYSFWRYLEDEERPKILNMVPTNPSLNREWLAHLASVLEIEEVVSSTEQDLEISNTVTKLLTDNIQVTTRNLFEAAGRYHIPPVKIDSAYFGKVIDAVIPEKILTSNENQKEKEKQKNRIVNVEKLTKLYFEEFLPTVLNTDSFLDKAIARGKEIGFNIKEAGEEIWVLRSTDGTSIAEKSSVSEQLKKPSICFKLSVSTLLKLLEKKLPLHRAVLFREVEVAGNPLKVVKVVRLVEKSFNENTLSKDQLENVLA
ncbi:MAG: SCP2 sterol-binding domain-containing protein [Cyanobacteriota/Melainabacteria group bacterium]|nr:SCP2 sterol-binding domain-containing protein [Cyanobacteria bacterium HKST-UBA01]MCB9468587.1 SCP2 sterol-binding domain-containing protein [Candidatus Obscuribacterales bacterium]